MVLQEEARLLQVRTRALQDLSEGVWIGDASGRMSYVNAGFIALTGYLPAEAQGQSWTMLQVRLAGCGCGCATAAGCAGRAGCQGLGTADSAAVLLAGAAYGWGVAAVAGRSTTPASRGFCLPAAASRAAQNQPASNVWCRQLHENTELILPMPPTPLPPAGLWH